MTHEEHYDRALEALASGNFDGAVTEYQKALEVNPTFTDALHGLAQAYGQQGKLEEAIAAAQRIAEIDPEDPLAHTSLSRLYQRQGKITEAEEEANKARVLSWKQQLKEGKKPNPADSA